MSVVISPIQPEDEAPFLEAVARSRELLGGWVNPPCDPERFARHIARYSAEHNVSYLARTGEGDLIGCININNIVRGAFQSGALGYYALSPHSGRGLMKQAMAQVIHDAFHHHQLHRLEANIQPANVASSALVRSLGFRFEGHSPLYLRIDGQWRDHDRYAITVEDRS